MDYNLYHDTEVFFLPQWMDFPAGSDFNLNPPLIFSVEDRWRISGRSAEVSDRQSVFKLSFETTQPFYISLCGNFLRWCIVCELHYKYSRELVLVQALWPKAGRKKQKKCAKISVFDIPSSYAKIWGETNFQPWEFPWSGSRAKKGEEKRRKKEGDWKLVLTMASYVLQTPPLVAHLKPPGPIEK